MAPVTWEQAVLWLRAQPDQQELVRACYYDDPLLEAAKRFSSSAEWLATLKLLPRTPGRALDLGAGRGISSYALACGGWQVTALEPDPSDWVGVGAIRALAVESHLSIEAVQGIGEGMEFGEGTFDLVYAREVLHHTHNLNKTLQEIARVLQPGGVFIACREHVIRRKEDLQAFLENHPLHRLYGGENAFLLDEYLSALRASGLKLRRVYGHYETPINYFPLSEAEWHEAVTAPARKRLGRLASFLCDPPFPWSRSVTQMMASAVSGLSRSPGILYTFLAAKPR